MICYLLESSASTSGRAWHTCCGLMAFIGRLAKACLDQLYQGFTKNRMGHASSAILAEAVGALLSRYKDGYKESAANTTKLHNHWATPDTYMHALAEGLSTDTDCFASPLNCSAHLTKYFSRYDEDAAFGANVDAFSSRWAVHPSVILSMHAHMSQVT